MGVHHRHLGLALERRPAGEALVEHAAERVDVGATVERQPLDLLGRSVLDGAYEDACPCEVGGRRLLRDAEVGEVHVLGGLGDQDVGRLHVAVDQVPVVSGVERACDLLDHVERAADAQPSVPLEQRAKVGAVDVSHGDVQQPVGVAAVDLSRVVDRDDVGMVEPCRSL